MASRRVSRPASASVKPYPPNSFGNAIFSRRLQFVEVFLAESVVRVAGSTSAAAFEQEVSEE